ncbi:MAG TPA: HAMP domain-containing sensor histidine kinase [Pseudolabrys sp.]|nr:HAMP domain-containing sensor histidine kinase [Pseudolabrys sp.]
MKTGSLRLRLVLGGVIAILIALAVAGGGLVFLFERHVTRTIGDDLDIYLNQLIAGIDVDVQGQLVLTRPPADPRFSEPLSGLYWQIADDRGQMLRSRSLWDTTLALVPDEPVPGQIHHHVIDGPLHARILVAERMVGLTGSDRHIGVRVAVAVDLARVSRAASSFSRDLAAALGVLGLVLALATVVQVGLGLQPLKKLQRSIADVRAGRTEHLPAAAPAEVQPLVEELNALLDAQEREIQRSRGRAADLAHGLKTPLAALTGDARRLREAGHNDIAQDIETVTETMSRQVDRELARARSRGSMRRRGSLSTELAPLVRMLIATIARTPAGARVSFEQKIPDTLAIAMDRTDLAEALGNILDNAARHAAAGVRITASPEACGATIVIEDDGQGIASETQARVVERGIRLDQRTEGAGLGLAIVQDVLESYGWSLTLGTSEELGGLRVTLSPDGPQSQADRFLTRGVMQRTPAAT